MPPLTLPLPAAEPVPRMSPSLAFFHRRALRRVWALGLGLALLGLALALLGLSVGSAGLEPVWQMLADSVAAQIVWDIRAPRTLGAFAAGALLGLAGALAQGLFRNPLADPFLLGSASGASLGVALALVALGVSPFAAEWAIRLGLTGAAFAGAVGAVLLTLQNQRLKPLAKKWFDPMGLSRKNAVGMTDTLASHFNGWFKEKFGNSAKMPLGMTDFG